MCIGIKMTAECELSGVKVMVGNKVSHSQRKTRRTFKVNLHEVRLLSEALGETHRFKIAARTLRTVDKHGGLDPFLLSVKNAKISAKALKLKKRIQAKAQQDGGSV